MLDFYLIEDNHSTPENPEQLELELIGKLSLKEFTDLQDKKIISLKESYFSDFRWDQKTVNLKLKSDLFSTSEKSEVKIVEFLNHATKSKCGLIAFCD